MNSGSRPRVLIDPAPRRMGEVFARGQIDRLRSVADIVWGHDEPMSERELSEALAESDAVVFGAWRHPVDPAATAPRLRAMLEVSGGHHHPGIGYTQLLERGVRIGSSAPAFAGVVAEMGVTMALAAQRGLLEADRSMRHGTERWLHDGNDTNASLLGATVGFVGCGGIAVELLRMLAPFGVDPLGYDPPLGDTQLRARGLTPVELGSLFDRASVVFVLAAPTESNHHLVDRSLLEQLTPDQTLVVLSRAHLVDFPAAEELARAGRFTLATDVYPDEPLPTDATIRTVESTILVPHIAGAMPSALLEIGRAVVDDLLALFAGDEPHRLQYLDPTNVDGLVQASSTLWSSGT